MKAAVYIKSSSGKNLQILDLETPVPRENEVLIKVRAASVNPLDWRMKSSRPGVDVAGQVELVGKNVTRFKPGDAVFGMGKGCFAEYACALESALVLKPDNATFEQAASIPIAGLTALQGLRKIGRLQPGQKVLINGAAGGVGTFAVQIARALGAHITGVCSPGNSAQTLKLGAERVIDYTQTDFTTGTERYDVLLDNVGNRSLTDMRRVLASRGRCVLVGAPKELWPILARVLKAFAWSPFLRQKFIFFIAKMRPDDLAALREMVQSGKVTPVIDRMYPLTATAEAMAYAEAGHARAKVVLSLGGK